MNLSDYQTAVKRTCVTTDLSDTLKLALIGLQDELGEVAGPLKKTLWHGHPLDLGHLHEELGDVLWYLATLCNALDLSLEQIMQSNLAKLQRRYPQGFSPERSLTRHETAGCVQAQQMAETSEDPSDTDLLARLHRQLWEATTSALVLTLGRDLSVEGGPARRVCFQLGLLLQVLARRNLVPLDVSREDAPPSLRKGDRA